MEEKINLNVTTENGEVIIRRGDAKKPFDYMGTIYKALSTESFVTLVQARMSNHTVVGYHDRGFKAILDDSIKDAYRDRVNYEFENSLQLVEWMQELDNDMKQKELIDFLKCRRTLANGDDIDEVQDLEMLLYNLQNFKFVQNIEADYSRDDDNNYTFAFKSKDGEGTVQLPQSFFINLEFIKGSGFIQIAEIQLEIKRPKSADEKPLFVLRCPRMARYGEVARKHESEKLQELLKDTKLILVNALV